MKFTQLKNYGYILNEKDELVDFQQENDRFFSKNPLLFSIINYNFFKLNYTKKQFLYLINNSDLNITNKDGKTTLMLILENNYFINLNADEIESLVLKYKKQIKTLDNDNVGFISYLLRSQNVRGEFLINILKKEPKLINDYMNEHDCDNVFFFLLENYHNFNIKLTNLTFFLDYLDLSSEQQSLLENKDFLNGRYLKLLDIQKIEKEKNILDNIFQKEIKPLKKQKFKI